MKDGVCPKCRTEFERPDYEIEIGHPGFFCPECRRIGFSSLGIVHFTPDVKMNKLPKEITTA